jgi:hypothetical protein
VHLLVRDRGGGEIAQSMQLIASATGQAYNRRKRRRGAFYCLVLEVARKAGHMPLGTFDRNLAKLDGAQRLR